MIVDPKESLNSAVTRLKRYAVRRALRSFFRLLGKGYLVVAGQFLRVRGEMTEKLQKDMDQMKASFDHLPERLQLEMQSLESQLETEWRFLYEEAQRFEEFAEFMRHFPR